MEPKISARWSGALPVRAFVAFDACVRACARMANTRQKCRNVTSSTHRNENIVHRLLPYRYHACIVFPGGTMIHTRVQAAHSRAYRLRAKLNPPSPPRLVRRFLSRYNCCVFGRLLVSDERCKQIRALDANERAIDIDTSCAESR